MKVLVLGGYGNFGSRLARLLADEPRLTIFVVGRSLEKAEAFARGLAASATIVAARIDRDGDLAAQFQALAPQLVIDASGPFQVYGDEAYRLAEAALRAGANYADLADGAAFVAGIGKLDALARERGLFALSGVSTTPALTGAVLRCLGAGMREVTEYSGGIAPSPRAEIGANVYRAIASYAGKEVPRRRQGGDGTAFALIEARHFTIAPPGYPPLRSRRFTLIDVPDLTLFSHIRPELRDAWFGAGTVPEIMHRALSALAWLVRLRALPSLLPFALLMHRASRFFNFGEHRGGLFVAICGKDGAGAVERSFHLIAEGDDGPFIPSMAAEILVRKCLVGDLPPPGARSAEAAFELIDFDAAFARRRIVTSIREHRASADEPVFKQLLGDAWARLPVPVQELHGAQGEFRAEGRAAIERGSGWLAQIVARVMGFPDAGTDVPVSVAFSASPDREIWTRTFGGKIFQSELRAGKGASAFLLDERFGPVRVGIALSIDGERLRWTVRRWSFFGIPLPAELAPGGDTYEFAKDGRFHFNVEIRQPVAGLIVRYRGWLVPSHVQENTHAHPL